MTSRWAGTRQKRCGAIKLILQINDVSFAHWPPGNAHGFSGLLAGQPSSSFAPLAVTRTSWAMPERDGRVHLPLQVHWNGQWFGQPHGGRMNFSFGQLIAHAA